MQSDIDLSTEHFISLALKLDPTPNTNKRSLNTAAAQSARVIESGSEAFMPRTNISLVETGVQLSTQRNN